MNEKFLVSHSQKFQRPLSGEKVIFFCIKCKKSFMATVPAPSFFDIFKHASITKVKCPDCVRVGRKSPMVKIA